MQSLLIITMIINCDSQIQIITAAFFPQIGGGTALHEAKNMMSNI